MSIGFGSYRLSQAAGPVRVVEDFIVEDWEVEGQAKPDRVCWLHLPLANVKSLLVSLLGVVHCICRQKQINKTKLLSPPRIHFKAVLIDFFGHLGAAEQANINDILHYTLILKMAYALSNSSPLYINQTWSNTNINSELCIYHPGKYKSNGYLILAPLESSLSPWDKYIAQEINGPLCSLARSQLCMSAIWLRAGDLPPVYQRG